jgi:hypothetical protein
VTKWPHLLPPDLRERLEIGLAVRPRLAITFWSIMQEWLIKHQVRAALVLSEEVPPDLNRDIETLLYFSTLEAADLWARLRDWLIEHGVEAPEKLPAEQERPRRE